MQNLSRSPLLHDTCTLVLISSKRNCPNNYHAPSQVKAGQGVLLPCFDLTLGQLQALNFTLHGTLYPNSFIHSKPICKLHEKILKTFPEPDLLFFFLTLCYAYTIIQFSVTCAEKFFWSRKWQRLWFQSRIFDSYSFQRRICWFWRLADHCDHLLLCLLLSLRWFMPVWSLTRHPEGISWLIAIKFSSASLVTTCDCDCLLDSRQTLKKRWQIAAWLREDKNVMHLLDTVE